jgi:outer membrane protein assembly factor BamB
MAPILIPQLEAMSQCSGTLTLVLLATLSAAAAAADSSPQATANDSARALPGSAEDWPRWHGPLGNGAAIGEAPTSWSPTENVVWKASVPGRGHASPIVCGDAIYIATGDADAQEQRLLCFGRATGKERWNTLVHSGGIMHMHDKNSAASPTAACDGQRVFVAFINDDAQWISAVDLAGKIVWQEKVGPFTSQHGDGPSPVLHGSLVILNTDGVKEGYLAALDRETGKQVWLTPRVAPGHHGNYGGPALVKVGDKTQVVLPGRNRTMAYDVETGKEIWSCEGPADVAGNTVASGEGLVFSSGGFPQRVVLAIKPDGEGDVTESHIVWRSEKAPAYVPSPLYHDGRLYVISDNGVATCYRAADGDVLWTHRLGGDFTASPVIAGDKIYAASEKGIVHVFAAGDKFDGVAEIDMGEGIMATPAIAGGRIYLRTAGSLYCIGE